MKRKIEEQLEVWADRCEGRMPLVLSGARQVGKTHALRSFGSARFSNTVYINLETDPVVAAYFDGSIQPQHIVRYLEASSGQRITPGKTLLILDEIQSCERALTALKYFCEDMPELHVAAAGSLLGVAINRERYSYPVGKVETLGLHPLDFEEYLWARGKEGLAVQIRESFDSAAPMPEPLHQEALALYREYLVVGGMPAAVKAYTAQESFLDVPSVQRGILDSYIADMAKYASASEAVKIRACYNSIPAQLAKDNKKFQYKVVRRGGSAALFGASIEWLNLAGVVLKCTRVTQGVEPLAAYADLPAFKLYLGDTGLLTAQSGVSLQTVLGGGGNLFLGALAENYVAQQMAARGHPLYYWESNSTAEVDFVLQREGHIVPVEVKAGEHVRSRSLSVFAGLYDPEQCIRLSQKNFGKRDGLKSVPLYAAFCL